MFLLPGSSECKSSDLNDTGDREPSFLDNSLVTPGEADRQDMSLVRLDMSSEVSEVDEFCLFRLDAPAAASSRLPMLAVTLLDARLPTLLPWPIDIGLELLDLLNAS